MDKHTVLNSNKRSLFNNEKEHVKTQADFTSLCLVEKASHTKCCLIPFKWPSNKGKNKGTENTSVVSREPLRQRHEETCGNYENGLYFDCGHDYTSIYFKRVNFIT